MAKPHNKCLDYAVYAVARLLAAAVQLVPLRSAYRAARCLGALLYRLDRRHRQRAVGHLRRSFPQWSPRRVRRVAQASMRSLAYLGLEFLHTWRISPTTWRRHIRLHNMDEALRLVLERKTGLILVTGHFGNWEVLGYTIAALGFANVTVARPLDNPALDAYVRRRRQRAGLWILDKRGAVERLDDLLDSGAIVGFIVDQDAGRKGLFVEFFGRAASTYKSIGLMAMRHEVPIVVGYGRRLGAALRFEIGVERIIYPRQWSRRDEPLRWITQTYTTALERIVRRHPSQYLWAHRRWKHRPKGEPEGPDGIA